MSEPHPPRRMPPPWIVEETPGGFRIVDADGKALAYCYGLAPDEMNTGTSHRLTLDEARRIAAAIARIPDLMKRPGT